MSKPIRVIALAVAAILLVGAGICLRGCNRNRDALAKYKAELRAKGEKLSAEELGYPKPPEKSKSLDQLQASANRASKMRFQPSSLDFMSFSGPGQVRVLWALPRPAFHSGAANSSDTWETIATQFTDAADITMELREAVKTPPRYFYNDPTNFLNAPKGPYVGIRTAAQWLAGDAMVALHERRVDDAALDIRALAQLSQFHHEDLTLVSQMIRVAVAGLGLAVTWEALQAEGWNEELLAGLQKDWEAVSLADTFETGMVGERAFGGAVFGVMRSASSPERTKFIRLNTVAGPVQLKSPKDYFDAYLVMPFWAANADEMFFLEHHQRNLDAIRKLRTGVRWSSVSAELNSNCVTLNAAFSSPMARFRYPVCAIAIPNFLKAANVCIKSETQRRMTVTVIALERCRTRTGTYPSSLEALVPQFLSAVPVDPMSARPLRYRLNPDGTFTLYSVNEDGRDDGGDAASGSVASKIDLWSGRDAVWPVAEKKNRAG